MYFHFPRRSYDVYVYGGLGGTLLKCKIIPEPQCGGT